MEIYQNMYEHLNKSLNKLSYVIEISEFENTISKDIIRDSMLQRFKICYELAWKTLRDYLTYLGFSVYSTPLDVFKTAYQNRLIDNQEIWLSMIEDRDMYSHEYDDYYFEEIAYRIKKDYIIEFSNLINVISDSIKDKENIQ